jgi:hypothetical protein
VASTFTVPVISAQRQAEKSALEPPRVKELSTVMDMEKVPRFAPGIQNPIWFFHI